MKKYIAIICLLINILNSCGVNKYIDYEEEKGNNQFIPNIESKQQMPKKVNITTNKIEIVIDGKIYNLSGRIVSGNGK